MSFLKNIFVGCRRNSFNCSNLECPLPTNNMFYFWNIFNSLAQICKILPLSPFPLHLQPLFSLSLYLSFFLKNGPTPASFHVFSSFQTNITILTTNKCEKCPSSIRRWDSNSQPSYSKSPLLTTRPGLPLSIYLCFYPFLYLPLSVQVASFSILSLEFLPRDVPLCFCLHASFLFYLHDSFVYFILNFESVNKLFLFLKSFLLLRSFYMLCLSINNVFLPAVSFQVPALSIYQYGLSTALSFYH